MNQKAMRKIAFLLILVLHLKSNAQDKIYLKNGESREVSVHKINYKDIQYTVFNDANKQVRSENANNITLIQFHDSTHYIPNKKLKWSLNFDFNLLGNKASSFYYEEESGRNQPYYSALDENKPYHLGFSAGINALLGRRLNNKILLSFGYTIVKNQFQKTNTTYIKGSGNEIVNEFYTKQENVHAITNLLIFKVGFHIKLYKHTYFNFGRSLSNKISVYGKSSGYIGHYTRTDPWTSNSEVTNFQNEKYNTIDNGRFALNFLQLEFGRSILKRNCSLFLSYNFQLDYTHTKNNADNLEFGLKLCPAKTHNKLFIWD